MGEHTSGERDHHLCVSNHVVELTCSCRVFIDDTRGLLEAFLGELGKPDAGVDG